MSTNEHQNHWMALTSWFSIQRIKPSSSSGKARNFNSASAKGSHSLTASSASLKSSAYNHKASSHSCPAINENTIKNVHGLQVSAEPAASGSWYGPNSHFRQRRAVTEKRVFINIRHLNRSHNPTSQFPPSPMPVVITEPFPDRKGPLLHMSKEICSDSEWVSRV